MDSMASSSKECQCPICGEPFPTLAVVEAHLATLHYPGLSPASQSHSPNSPFSSSANPFANFIDQTKRLLQGSKVAQPTAFQDVLAGKDIFELNENPADLTPNGLSDEDYDRFLSLPAVTKMGNLQDWIRKTHWRKNAVQCHLDGCGKPLGLVNGRVNCARCGLETCNDHSRFQEKLSVDAKHDPVHGFWARVCFKCFSTRKGYAQTMGVVRTRTASFLAVRAVKVAQTLMEVNKMEKRLERIASSIQEAQTSATLAVRASFLMGLTKSAVEPIVEWAPDGSSTQCSQCATLFGFVNRKHHCRLCGSLICHSCSSSVEVGSDIGVRTCPGCFYLLSLRKQRDHSGASQVPIVELYSSFVRHKGAVLSLLPRFNALLYDMKTRGEISQNDQDFQVSLRLRKELLDLFAAIDQIAKRIKALPTEKAGERRFQDSVFVALMSWLQQNMFTLQLMPSVAKRKEAELPPIQHEAVLVIEETIDQLNEALREAIARRKFEDAEAIRGQLHELSQELELKKADL
ncbi:carboxypeptidase Y-deficient [Kappamyces sp. JEL0829]|nr:carboxypeptidase Y-deficient [Kappamyces sp. JEL0829]